MGSKRSNKRGRCDDSGSSAGLESPTAVQRRHARHAGKEVTDGGGPTSPHSPPAKGQRSGGATDDGVAFPRLSSLIDPLTLKDFFGSVWEEKPRVFSNQFTTGFFPGKFSFESLLELTDSLASEGDALDFGLDINAARYRDGIRETPNRKTADRKTLRKMFADEGITFQLHQPQRFDRQLAAVMMDLEAELGCLVGCNAYLTPKGSQGLAPHHDDVEIFVCQTKGSKRWKLYGPLNGFKLPGSSSGDFPEEVIGNPSMEVVLKEGDVLYMPRGTIHQAAAQDTDSAHLTISTYQRWTWGDLASNLMQQAVAAAQDPLCVPLAGRRSLPPGFLYDHGLETSSRSSTRPVSTRKQNAATVASCLREMATRIEEHPELLDIAADAMALDLQKSRLAPLGDELPPPGAEPAEDSKVAARCRKGTFRVVPAADGEGLMLLHCLNNDRMLHMMPMDGGGGAGENEASDESTFSGAEEDDAGLDSGSMAGPFPEDWMDAVVQVLNSNEPLPLADLDIDDASVPCSRLEIARFLWRCGALRTVS